MISDLAISQHQRCTLSSFCSRLSTANLHGCHFSQVHPADHDPIGYLFERLLSVPHEVERRRANLDHAELIVRELRFQRVGYVGQHIELAARLEHLAFAGRQDNGLVGPVAGCKHLDGEFLHFALAFCLLSARLMRPIHFRTRKT